MYSVHWQKITLDLIKILTFFETSRCLGSAVLELLEDEKQKLRATKVAADALKF